MTYRFRRREPVAQGMRRIAREQIVRAVVMARDASTDPHERVHQVRRRIKKLRGLLRLVRSGLRARGLRYRDENARCRDVARGLSEARDARIAVETLDGLLERYAGPLDRTAFAGVRAELVRAHAEHHAEHAAPEASLHAGLEEAVERLTEAHERVATWRLKGKDSKALWHGLARTYARGCRALERARDEPTTEHFHEWRKRVQYHGFHGRLLRSIWRGPMDARREELDALSDLLGADHDLSVLAQALGAAPTRPDVDAVSALLGLAVQRRRGLRREALTLGARVFAEEPPALVSRWKAQWRAWRRDEPEEERLQELELVRGPLERES